MKEIRITPAAEKDIGTLAMRQHHLRWYIVLICMLALLVSCATVENVRLISLPDPFQENEIKISAQVISTAQLIERYGRNPPFIAPSRLITPFEYLAIEIFFDYPETYGSLNLRDIRFFYSTFTDRPRTSTEMLAFWEREISVHGDDRVTPRYRNIIRANMLPTTISGSSLGLLIFRGTFPLAGMAELIIPYPNSYTPPTTGEQDAESTPSSQSIRIPFEFTYQEQRTEFKLF